MFYLLVAGSRNYNNYNELKTVLDFLLKNVNKEIVIVSGGANGADTLAEQYANERHYKSIVMRANWKLFGKSAGYQRNLEMHNFISKYDNRGCVLFWDMISKGTQMNIAMAEDYDNPIKVFNIKKHCFVKKEDL